ncbi:Integrase catalytic core protein [Phytophthora palmivora]|uniref:Integrase catalytic core protein n=1 Tax=Phytophthora palmivora TaxID=4796 RepID=A0A2P4XYS6_9STRA|nr:Integrase catalytic core protein [Phytophthora palmivora]
MAFCKEPWAVVHARLCHIPFKRYKQLLTMAERVTQVTDGVTGDAVCAGCCMGKMRADYFPRYPEKLVKSAGVLELVHTDVMGPIQTKTPGGCTYVITFIEDYSRHVTIYFMKAKSDVLARLNIFKAALDNATGKKMKRLRLDNGGEYTR